MSKMLDGNTAALREHEAREDARQRSFDQLQGRAERAAFEKLVDEGMSETEATAFLMTGDGADLVEAEVERLEEYEEDRAVDARIDQYRERNEEN